MTILVTGATGNVGRPLVDQLVADGQHVRALTRNPAIAGLPDGVEVVQGDLGRPDSLNDAFAGVDRVHFMTTHVPEAMEAAPEVAGIAKKAGVRRATVMTGGGDDTVVRAVRQAGIECTHLEPGEFMMNTLDWAAMIRSDGVVRAPFGNWTTAMIHEKDIAEVAAAVLSDDGPAAEKYVLTGEQELTRREVVHQLGKAIGREIEFVELTPDQAREHWIREGIYPAEVVEWFIYLGTNLVDSTSPASQVVKEVTGRPARRFAEWAAEHAADFD